jgi:chemotaxis protein methyltransferase CheR
VSEVAAHTPLPGRGGDAVPDLPTLSDQEFALFRALLQRETGIHLTEAKRALLVGRLTRRLRELRLHSFGAYYRRVTRDGDGAEMVRMVDLITTNETHFFREPKQFELLAQVLVPAWVAAAELHRRPRSLRVWSAACSSGEEPFSVAMTLLHHLPGWRLEILATDLSSRILEQARAAVWRIDKAREIPEPYLKAFMLRGIGDKQGTMKAGAELRRVVQFAHANLHQDPLPVEGRFDLILCRNVLIYFTPATRGQVVRRLLRHLDPSGHLFLGHAETLSGIDDLGDRLVARGPSVYAWAPPKPPTAESPRRSSG